METVRTARAPQAAIAPRWLRLALCAAGLALGWMILSSATGWGASASHAADDDDRPGLLGSVTGLVESTVDVLPEPLEEVVEIVVDKPVAAVTTTVEKTVGTAADVVTKTTKKVAEAKPVTTVTKTVTTAVSKTPIVGAVVDELGADDILDHVSGAVDDVVSDAGRTVDTVVDFVTGGPVDGASIVPLPDNPATDPGSSPDPSAEPPSEGALHPADEAASPRDLASTADAFWGALAAASASETDASATAAGARDAHPTAGSASANAPSAPPGTPALLPAQVCAALGLSSGSSGSAAASGALPASEPSYARHAWSRVVGHGGWTAPPSPASSPDTSPD